MNVMDKRRFILGLNKYTNRRVLEEVIVPILFGFCFFGILITGLLLLIR